MTLKPPFWLLSLPLFLVLYRKTPSHMDTEDKRDDGEGKLFKTKKITFSS